MNRLICISSSYNEEFFDILTWLTVLEGLISSTGAEQLISTFIPANVKIWKYSLRVNLKTRLYIHIIDYLFTLIAIFLWLCILIIIIVHNDMTLYLLTFYFPTCLNEFKVNDFFLNNLFFVLYNSIDLLILCLELML